MPEPVAPVPAAPAPAPVAPSLPATVTLPGEPSAAAADAAAAAEAGVPLSGNPPPDQLDTDRGATERDAELGDIFGGRVPAAKPAAVVKPPPAATPAVPAVPPAPVPPVPAVPPTPPVPAAVKPVEPPAKVEGDDLPADILEGISEQPPTNHREQVKQLAISRRRLAKAGSLLEKQNEELERLRKGGTPPADYEEVKAKAARLEHDTKKATDELAEVKTRLYATELRERPEFKEQVTDPWNDVKTTVGAICARYGQNVGDVWEALRMPKAEDRDAVLNELMSVMTPLDQRRFSDRIEQIPKIRRAQDALEADSKGQLENLRARDQQTVDRRREASVGRSVSALAKHRDVRFSTMPFLYKIEGDTPDVTAYNDGMARAVARAEEIARDGVDKLSPEVQGAMAFDAVTAHQMINGIGPVIQAKQARIVELEREKAELEAANKTLQSQVDEWKGVLPNGEGNPPGSAPASAEDIPLEQRTAAAAASLGWANHQ